MVYPIIIILTNTFFINICRYLVNIGNPHPCLLRWPEPQALFLFLLHALLKKYMFCFCHFCVFLWIVCQCWSIFVRTYLRNKQRKRKWENHPLPNKTKTLIKSNKAWLVCCIEVFIGFPKTENDPTVDTHILV